MKNLFETRGLRSKSFLQELFEKWDEVLETYDRKIYPWDLSYDHRERTNIGFLAAAATKLDCLVLEEFICDKRRRKEMRAGRGDLWLKTKRGREYQFEAKWIVPNVKTKSVQQEVRKLIKHSIRDDIGRIPRQDRAKKSAEIVFVVPYIPKRYVYDFAKLKRQLLDIKSLGADFVAIHFFAKEMSRLKYRRPCIAIVGKYA